MTSAVLVVQTVKERVRAHISHQLPFTLTTLGIAMFVLFCVSRLNYQTSGVSNNVESPRVAFSGRQTDMTLDFRAGFGEYAQCTVPNTDRSMEPRTEDCIVMLPSGNRTASVKMMSLKTGRMVMRDKFKLLPMPSTVVSRLNEMAAKEGRKVVTRTGMVYDLDGGLRNGQDPTYIQPTDQPTVDPANLADDVDYNNESDDDVDHSAMQEISKTADEPNVITYHDAPGFDRDSLDVGPLIELGEQQSDPEPEQLRYNSPERAPQNVEMPLGPVRSNVSTEPRAARMTGMSSPPLRRDLMTYHNSNDYAMNISVKEALRSRGDEAQHVNTKELAQMIEKEVWTPVRMSSLSSTEKAV